jgi:hypothetical protein
VALAPPATLKRWLSVRAETLSVQQPRKTHPGDDGAEDGEVLVIVVKVVGGEDTIVGPPFAEASWKSAMASGKTLTLSLYFARETPFWVTMFVVPTVLRQ